MDRFKRWLEKHSDDLVEVIVHVVAWGLYLTFILLSYLRQSDSEMYRAIYILGILATDLPLFYFYYLRAIPNYLNRGKRSWYFVAFTIPLILLYPFFRLAFDQILIYFFPNDLSPFANQLSQQFWVVYWVRVLGALFVLIMSGVGKFTFDWFKNIKIRRELEHQNLISEISFLKSQINPHFLFNTLNNIHTLAYKGAKTAPDAIMKLSELMRYMIYESDIPFVPLEKEVRYLNNYIDLQKLRLKSPEIISFSIQGDLKRYQIAPLLFIPLVENAFKHSGVLKEPDSIQLKLIVKESICFEVKNPIAKQNQQRDDQGGIGIENIKRRLELIYPGRYTFNTIETSSAYIVEIELNHG